MPKKSVVSEQLFYGAQNNRPELIEAVLSRKGVRVNAKETSFGMTALHVAASQGHTKVVEVLLQNGSDIEAREETGRTPLHTAAFRAQKQVVQILLEKGAKVNAQTKDGKTPLDWAIINENIELASFIRQYGGKTSNELSPAKTETA